MPFSQLGSISRCSRGTGGLSSGIEPAVSVLFSGCKIFLVEDPLKTPSLKCNSRLHAVLSGHDKCKGLLDIPFQTAPVSFTKVHGKVHSGFHRLSTCQAQENEQQNGRPFLEDKSETDSKFRLHTLIEESGVDSKFARIARMGFAREIAKLSHSRDAETPADLHSEVDLARAALEIAAEDDALISHSTVPLPVDAYLQRLDLMANEIEGHYLPVSPLQRTPDAVFKVMNNYIYGFMGFTRAAFTGGPGDARDFYLNGVLTRRRGTPLMLALIYSELANRLRQRGAIDFMIEMELPLDLLSLPRPRLVFSEAAFQAESEITAVVLKPHLLLFEILLSLKQLYWPWRSDRGSSGGSGFLEAAAANSHGMGMGIMGPAPGPSSTANYQRSGAELAAARAAQYRLQRGIWTSTGFGDIRRALAVSERLVLLNMDEREGRDYGVLLFHCGQYSLAHQYLTKYFEKRKRQLERQGGRTTNVLEHQEDAALSSLLERLTLILVERSWAKPTTSLFPQGPLPDPW